MKAMLLGAGRGERLRPITDTLPNNMQEITSGIDPGQQVVSNALVLQNAVEQ